MTVLFAGIARRARKMLFRKLHKERERRESTLRRRLTRREFACEADAQGALVKETERLPAYFEVEPNLKRLV